MSNRCTLYNWRYGATPQVDKRNVQFYIKSYRGIQVDLLYRKDHFLRMKKYNLDPATLGEIIEMALSDHASFDQIRTLHGLGPDDVKALMRQNLKSGSYRAWRKRVRTFSDRREVYK